MPGLKTPSYATPPKIQLPTHLDSNNHSNASTPRTTSRRFPSRSPSASPAPSSRPRFSPDRRKRTPPEKTPSSVDETPPPDDPDLGPFLLKLARGAVVSGNSPTKALDYATRASKCFEQVLPGRPDTSLGLALSLHVLAAIHCSMGEYDEAVRVLQRAVMVPDSERGPEHALSASSGYMQLGDAFSMLGQLDRSISAYELGLRIQIEAFGDNDPKVLETCRYLAEAYVQAMRLDDAGDLCKKMLKIHREHSAPASLDEATDRRLMALICETKGDYEAALEHLVLASMSMIANGQDKEVAAIDVSIGNVYTSLCRFDEAVFAYQKALTVFKSTKGDTHPSLASVLIRLADLYYRTGKLRESKSYCENVLRIYAKPMPGASSEEIATGLTEISAIYAALNDPEEGLKLLRRAIGLLENNPGQHSTIAAIEAQIGVMHYMVDRYWEARSSLESAVAKLRATGESRSSFFGVVLNQLGLVCVQLYKINEAAMLFEEARDIMEQNSGSCHSDTLAVYSNLAAAYDAMGRVDDAIGILEYILRVREEELGTANPLVGDEKKRLGELLRESGRSQSRKARSLETLLCSKSPEIMNEETKWHSGLISKT